MLLDYLSPAEKAEWLRMHQLTFRGSDGDKYTVRRCTSEVIQESTTFFGGMKWYRHCLVCRDVATWDDIVLANILLLRADARQFRKWANTWPL